MGELKVSVAFTVLNEGDNIVEVVKRFGEQTRKPDEVVICDGGSTDGTVGKLKEMAMERGIPIKIVVEEGACRGAGRNRAIEAAEGPYIALTDAGNTADKRWLERLLSPVLDDPGVQVVYGTVMPLIEDRFSKCLAPLTIGYSHVNGRLCPSLASLLIRKDLWREIGGFPEGLTTGEDLIFLKRLKASGARSSTMPDAIVSWTLPGSLGEVFKRISAYSRGGLEAGFFRTWHLGTLRNCLIYSFLTGLGVFVNPVLLSLPFSFHFLRVHKYMRQMPWLKHHGAKDAIANYLLSGVIQAVIDMASLNGLVMWIVLDKCRLKNITTLAEATNLPTSPRA